MDHPEKLIAAIAFLNNDALKFDTPEEAVAVMEALTLKLANVRLMTRGLRTTDDQIEYIVEEISEAVDDAIDYAFSGPPVI